MSESGPYENPRTDPLKADLAHDHESHESQSREEDRRGRPQHSDTSASSEESEEEELQHSKYMAYKYMVRRSGSSEVNFLKSLILFNKKKFKNGTRQTLTFSFSSFSFSRKPELWPQKFSTISVKGNTV